MNLTEEIKSKIRTHAVASLPNECCGLITLNGLFESRNIADNPQEDFLLHWVDYAKAERLGKVIASYHSHPNSKAQQSLIDEINCNGTRLIQVIYGVQDNEFQVFLPKQTKNSYLGKIFQWDKSDCLTLAIDYYNNELKLNLKDGNYPSRIKNKNWGSSYQFIENANFEIIAKGKPNLSTLKKHDCIMTRCVQNRPPHILIYLGAKKVLHQPMDSYSKIEEYNEDFQEKTLCVARYKQFLD